MQLLLLFHLECMLNAKVLLLWHAIQVWHYQCRNFICVGFSISVVPLFRQAAKDLVESTGLPAIDVLAKALAKISVSTNNSVIWF